MKILDSFNITYNNIKRNLRFSLIFYFVAILICFINFVIEYLSIISIMSILVFIAYAFYQFYSSWHTTEKEFEMLDKVIILFSTMKQSKN